MLELKVSDNEKTMELKWDGYEKKKEEVMVKGLLKSFNIDVSDFFDEEIKKDQEKQYKSGYQLFKNDIKGLHKPQSEYNTSGYSKEMGVRTILGTKHYQTFYICPECGNKGKHFVPDGARKINCHKPDCSHEMPVRLADSRGLPHQDEFGNYFIAGDFKRTLKDKEEEDQAS
ncbi:hypothetical protein [Fictibacillus sp. NRS-1165]|uniref:hypothetical protein n=1 Tax=Fictibacillus sp. NRS-1165 TaxID=3144463 RepID=UPI003D1EA98E